MSVAAFIKALRTSGVSADQILDAVETMEQERLAKGRARTAKCRNAKRNGDVTSVTDVTHVTPPVSSPMVSPQTPLPLTPSLTPKEKAPKGAQKKTPRDELETVLDAEHAAAVVEHRVKLRKPLTPHAAHLLAGKFAEAPEPNAAADAMIANGWQGFELDWMANRGTGPPNCLRNGHSRKLSTAEQAIHELDKYRDLPKQHSFQSEADCGTGATLETSDFRRIG